MKYRLLVTELDSPRRHILSLVLDEHVTEQTADLWVEHQLRFVAEFIGVHARTSPTHFVSILPEGETGYCPMPDDSWDSLATMLREVKNPCRMVAPDGESYQIRLFPC